MASIELITNLVTLGLFIAIFIVLSREKVDSVAYALLLTLTACLLTSLVYHTPSTEYLTFIPFRTLLYIIAMNILIMMVEQHKIFQFAAVKIIHLTQSNPRTFFFLICSIAAIFSGFLEDVSVTVIFLPLVVRACKILQIEVKPYVIGITLSITIGNLLSPYASPTNILVSDIFQLSIGWYLSNFLFLFVAILAATLYVIDYKMVRNIPPPSETQKRILMEIMDPNLVILNKSRFYRNWVYLLSIFVGMILSPTPYLVVVIGVLVICVVERDTMKKYFERTDWNLIFFLIAIFLMVGCLTINGTINSFIEIVSVFMTGNLFVAFMFILIFSSLMAGFASRTMTMAVFSSLLISLFTAYFSTRAEQNILLIALIIGGTLGGNLMPHSSSHVMKTISYANEEKIIGINYKGIMRACFWFSIFSIIMGLVYYLIWLGLYHLHLV